MIGETGPVHLNIERSPILAQVHRVNLEPTTIFDPFSEVLEAMEVVGTDDLLRGEADQLPFPVAVQAVGDGIRRDDLPIQIEDKHRIRRRFEDAAILILPLPEHLFVLFPRDGYTDLVRHELKDLHFILGVERRVGVALHDKRPNDPFFHPQGNAKPDLRGMPNRL